VALIFLFVVVVIVPHVTESLYGYRFNFLGAVLVNNSIIASHASESVYGDRFNFYMAVLSNNSIVSAIIEGRYTESLLANFFSFFGLLTVPCTLAPLLRHPSGEGVVTGQEANWIVVSVTLAVCAAFVWVAYRRFSSQIVCLRRTMLATLLFVLFMSALAQWHVPFISGYVYGCAIAVFLSLLAGLAMALMQSVWSRRLMVGLIVAVALIQLYNFNAINRSWIAFHKEGCTRSNYEKQLPIAQDGRRTTRAELSNIWKAWKVGQLDSYLHDHQISSGAVFLIFELRYLDGLRALRTKVNDPDARGLASGR